MMSSLRAWPGQSLRLMKIARHERILRRISTISMTLPCPPNSDISYDTSSKDPMMVRSRVFIGNINRGPVSRDDLIDLFTPFGKLRALTFFKAEIHNNQDNSLLRKGQTMQGNVSKGYAFVQFHEGYEADAACVGLNGKRWKGAIIDVHLAMNGPGKTSSARAPTGLDSRKRRYDDDRDVVEETVEQNRRNREAALHDQTVNSDLAEAGVFGAMADTLICGSCRFVTCDFEIFRDHRIAGCLRVKDKDEPPAIRCASCNARFVGSWALIIHLTDFHRMQLFKVEDNNSEEPVAKRPTDAFVSIADRLPLGKDQQPSFEVTQNRPEATSENGTSIQPPSQQPIGSSASSVSHAGDQKSTTVGSNAAANVDAIWTPLTGQTITGLAGYTGGQK